MININKNNRMIIFFSCVALIAIYALLFGKYRPSEIDDAWTASYVWNLTHLGSTDDSVFGAISNIRYFGHIHAYIAGFIADHFGWSKHVFHAFNLTCVACAAFAWWLTASRLLKDKSLALLFTLLLFMLEPFSGAAFKARSDAFAFLLVSWSAYAASRNHFFPATLINSLGVEVHAVSSVGYFWICAFLLHFWHTESGLRKKGISLLGCVLGGIIGFILYRLIHPEPFSEILAYLTQSNTYQGAYVGGFSNALIAHYFTRAYFRFVPELAFWLVGAILYFYKKRRLFSLGDPVLCLFWATILASIIVRRGNFHYVIFFYPPLLMTALSGFRQTRLFRAAVACLGLYAVLIAGLLVWQNRHVDHAAFDRDLAAMGVPDDGTPVIGPTNAWFVLRERPFYANFGALKAGQREHPDMIYYIKSEYTEPLPECARVKNALGTPFMFNKKSMELFSVDLSQCPWQ